MTEQIIRLKEIWISDVHENMPSDEEITAFELRNNIVLPADLKAYFQQLNGIEAYDYLFFRFYSLKEFKSIDDELKDWSGVPDYSKITNTLEDYAEYYVFADYMIYSAAFAIRLHEESSIKNEVLAIIGDEYKLIADSFTEFMDLYLADSEQLYL